MIVAGFGFRTQATIESLRDALAMAAGGHKVSTLATLSEKAAAPAFKDLADTLALPVQAVDASDLSQVETLTQSPVSQMAKQTGSVAEATALVAAGPGAGLLCARVISTDRMASCALAQSADLGDKTK